MLWGRAWSVYYRPNTRVPSLASSSHRKLSICGVCFPQESASPLPCFGGQVLLMLEWAKQGGKWSWGSRAAADPVRLCHCQLSQSPGLGLGAVTVTQPRTWSRSLPELHLRVYPEWGPGHCLDVAAQGIRSRAQPPVLPLVLPVLISLKHS